MRTHKNATPKFRSERNHQLNHGKTDLRQPGMGASHQQSSGPSQASGAEGTKFVQIAQVT